MSEVKNIPKHWHVKKLGEVCEIIMGQSPPSATYNYSGIGLPFFQGKAEFTELYPVVEKWCNAPNKISLPNDILLSVRAPVGTTNIANQKCCIGRGLAAIRYQNYKYIFYFLRSIAQQLDKKGTGTTFRAISGETIRTTEIPLPPAQEQQLIVSKIEELLSDLDNGKQQLLIAQQQLKVYRQSLLKWAFEGKLTNKNVKEGELSKGWKLTNLGTVLNNIEAGKSFKCDERTPSLDEVGVLKVSAVTWQIFNEFESKTVIGKDRINKDYFVKQDDFLFSRANTLDLIGAVVIVTSIERNLMLSDKTLRFRFNSDVIPKYILYYLRSRKGRKEIQRLSTGNQESMRNIGQTRIKQIEFPFCTKEEQQLVVNELESKLTVCDKIEETISQSLLQAETLRQSILKKAFEGKLI